MPDAPVDPLHRTSGPGTAWTRVNIAEGIPGVSTPLNWSLWDCANERMIRGAYCDIGVLSHVRVPPASEVDRRTGAIFYGRPALNVDVSRRLADLQPGTSGDALEEHYFGAVRPDATSRKSRRRYPTIARKLPVQWARLPRTIQRLHDETKPWWQRSVDPLAPADEEAARGRLADARRRFDAIARPHSALALLCGALTQQTASIAIRAGHAELLLDALGGYDSVEFETMNDLVAVRRGQLDLATLLARRGFQGPMQGEISSVPWRQDSAPVEALLDSLDLAGDAPGEVARERSARRERAEKRLLAAAGPLRRRFLCWLFGQAARMLPQRQVGKATMMMTLDVARASVRALGASLRSRGILDDPEDVFYLTLDEIDASRFHGARQRVEQRREQRAAYALLELPESWVGMVEPLEADPAASAEPLRGLGVSPGVAEGRVRVVKDGAGHLEPGEILVCETTDPSYAGYFLVAAGVVTDIGGAMGHGAIVARDVGIPCVVNTRAATRRLRTGDPIRIDGVTGTVELLDAR